MERATARKLAFFAMPTLAMLAPEAWAYLDPSTGSMILSAIVGLFATAALALKTFWYRLKALVNRDKPEPRAEATSGEGDLQPVGERPASD
jgi:multisubunit Na+/H+ antiporter MnhC subunit